MQKHRVYSYSMKKLCKSIPFPKLTLKQTQIPSKNIPQFEVPFTRRLRQKQKSPIKLTRITTPQQVSRKQIISNLKISLNRFEEEIDNVVKRYAEKEHLEIKIPIFFNKKTFHRYRIETEGRQEHALIRQPTRQISNPQIHIPYLMNRSKKKEKYPILSEKQESQPIDANYFVKHFRKGLTSLKPISRYK